MIAYLPEIYPDELVYSWFCRYYIHTGCITNTMTFQELLYNRCNNPSKEFIGHLNLDTAKLIQRLFVMDDLIIEHTMYPQYARFIPLQQKKNALYHIGYDFCDAHHLFAILPRTQADNYLKHCPLCVQEDRKKHGEAYWHRKHQIRNMSVCYIPKPKFLGNPALVFGNLELDFDTHFKPILSHNKDDEIFYLDRNEYQLQYWITNNGKVFDSDVGVYLKPDIKNTYYYVNLKKSKSKYEHVYIHYLVAYYFCKGWLNKEEVHHIDKNPLNNNYKNLIWVTHAEHMELHSLFETDKKAYRKRIREIRKENNKW